MSSRKFFVTLDLKQIQASLSRENRWQMSREEVHRWLRMMGYVPADGGWLADSRALSHLEPDELLDKKPMAEAC